MIVISQVAGLARQLESERLAETKMFIVRDSVFNWDYRGFEDVPGDDEDYVEEEVHAPTPSANGAQLPVADDAPIPSADGATRTYHDKFEQAEYSRVFRSSNKFKIVQMLESWEEPQEEKRVVSESCLRPCYFVHSLTKLLYREPFQSEEFCSSSRLLRSWI
jgi:hypothetical protein